MQTLLKIISRKINSLEDCVGKTFICISGSSVLINQQWTITSIDKPNNSIRFITKDMFHGTWGNISRTTIVDGKFLHYRGINGNKNIWKLIK